MESILRSSSSAKLNMGTIGPLRRSESSLAKIFPNMSEMLSREDRNQIKRLKAKRQRLRPNQTVSIDDSPMMMLPKARIRNDYNHLTRRSMSVISADDTSGLHLSTIPGSAIVAKSFSKSLRNHHHTSKSDADSGIGSMRRSVTFDEISVGRSSFKSIDDIDAISDITPMEGKETDPLSYEPFPEDRYSEMPKYVDTYSDNSFTMSKLPKVKQRKPSASTPEDTDENHEANCPICSGLTNETERIQRYFGGVDAFFKWFWSRWGKRSDANLQRRNNGARPRFCNIVKSVQLHSREGRDTSACTGDSGFDEFDFITRDGRLINRWRKDSGASYEEDVNYVFEGVKVTRSGLDGKPGTPTSVDEDLDRMDLNSTNKDDIDNDLIELVPPVVIVERLLDDEADRINTNKDKNNLTVPYDLDKYIKSDDIVASETPNQPPTTPEILTPKETVVAPPPPPPSNKKPCVTKKTLEKKPVNRPKKKEEMETPVDIPIKEPTLTPPPQVTEDKKEREIKVNLSEPALPEVKEPPPKQKKEKFKPEKFAIPTKPEKPKVEDDSLFDETLSNHLKKFELMVSDMTSPDESPRKHTNKPLKITGRLALSQQSSRFTLPMDMKELETMSPKEYLINYCKISKRRQNLYDNVYRQTVGAVTKPLPYKELEKALKNVLVDTLNNEYFKYICELLEIKEGEEVTCDLFSKIAALAERLLYPQYVTKETEDHKDYQKELIEVADFSALEWKFHGVKVRPEIQKLLKSLC